MDDLLCKLTGEQALEIVRRLAGKKGATRCHPDTDGSAELSGEVEIP